MTGKVPVRLACGALLAALALLLAGEAGAQVARPLSDPLSSLIFRSDRLTPSQPIAPLEDYQGAVSGPVLNGWAAFRLSSDVEWRASIDRRTGMISFGEGGGIGWIPGRGNTLTAADVAPYTGGKALDLAALEKIARAFLPRVSGLLGIDPGALLLNRARSGSPASHVWFVDFDVVADGLPIEGARVIFRVNNGNLVQFGSEYLPVPGTAVPPASSSRDQALASAAKYVGGFTGADSFLDAGSLHLMPVAIAGSSSADGFDFGKGRGLAKTWDFTFHRDGVMGTWRARVDAATGELLAFEDVNDYAQVTGGAYPVSPTVGPEQVRAMPYADLSSGGFANSAGIYSFGGGTVTSLLAGQFVKINDTCGAISQASDGSGNIAFSTSAGTDCTTPGHGGAGNTHASRTQFYQVNRIKEVGRGWLPANTWLTQQLTVNVNLNQTCNAYWNGVTLNFFKSGGGCGNTGEIAAVSLHEYGHGLDQNDGTGTAPEGGTGESYADITATIALHDSCIGPGFRGTNCSGYGDACTACTGVRDIDFAKHASNTPATVANFTQVFCPAGSGPCGREVHCESYVPSEAVWDFANRDLPNPGTGPAWTTLDRLWYLSRDTATSSFTCHTTSTFTSDGCNAGSWWKTMRTVDDDDGNLSNGTPHSCNLFAAFNRHLIACTTDAGANTCFAGCTQPPVPTLSLSGGTNSSTATWTNSGAGVVYDLFRNESGCNAGFIKVASALAGTSFTDNALADGTTYYYQVTALPSGDEACASVPSTCQSVTPGAPCTPPAAPTGLTATGGAGRVDLAWSSSAGATEYHVLRSTTSGGPYSQVGTATGLTFTDTSVIAGTTYFYVVRAATGPTCESGNSNEASATPTAPPDFSLSISPASVTVFKNGGTAIYTVTITRINGFANPVTLSVSGLPAGTTGSFSPNPASGTSSTLTLTVSASTVHGTFTFTVTGTGGSPTLTRTATAQLVKSQKPH
jgi:fibronectin type 3 domain-containing protein